MGDPEEHRIRMGAWKCFAHRISAVVVAVACIFFLSSCLSRLIEQPTFQLNAVTIESISLTEMNLVLGMTVQNPNPFDLEVKSLEFALFLNSREIGNCRLQKEVSIRKACCTELRVPLTANFGNLSGYLKSILTGEEIRYQLKGTARLKAGIGSKSFSFSKEGAIIQPSRFHSAS
jgi:LEA14-like dessication related protein